VRRAARACSCLPRRSSAEIETLTSDTTKTLEMHGADPKSGKVYKMMAINFTKQ
jgi:hypothetical protein